MTFYTNIDKVVAFSYPSHWFALFNTIQLVILLPLLFICVGFMYSPPHWGYSSTPYNLLFSLSLFCSSVLVSCTPHHMEGGLRSFSYESQKYCMSIYYFVILSIFLPYSFICIERFFYFFLCSSKHAIKYFFCACPLTSFVGGVGATW